MKKHLIIWESYDIGNLKNVSQIKIYLSDAESHVNKKETLILETLAFGKNKVIKSKENENTVVWLDINDRKLLFEVYLTINDVEEFLFDSEKLIRDEISVRKKDFLVEFIETDCDISISSECTRYLELFQENILPKYLIQLQNVVGNILSDVEVSINKLSVFKILKSKITDKISFPVFSSADIILTVNGRSKMLSYNSIKYNELFNLSKVKFLVRKFSFDSSRLNIKKIKLIYYNKYNKFQGLQKFIIFACIETISIENPCQNGFLSASINYMNYSRRVLDFNIYFSDTDSYQGQIILRVFDDISKLNPLSFVFDFKLTPIFLNYGSGFVLCKASHCFQFIHKISLISDDKYTLKVQNTQHIEYLRFCEILDDYKCEDQIEVDRNSSRGVRVYKKSKQKISLSNFYIVTRRQFIKTVLFHEKSDNKYIFEKMVKVGQFKYQRMYLIVLTYEKDSLMDKRDFLEDWCRRDNRKIYEKIFMAISYVLFGISFYISIFIIVILFKTYTRKKILNEDLYG